VSQEPSDTVGAELERRRWRARESRLTVVVEILRERAASYAQTGDPVPVNLHRALGDFARERDEIRRRLRKADGSRVRRQARG